MYMAQSDWQKLEGFTKSIYPRAAILESALSTERSSHSTEGKQSDNQKVRNLGLIMSINIIYSFYTY